MNYYFPSLITNLPVPKVEISKAFNTVNSGENAIRLLLRKLALPPKAKIALPLFVCDSLKNAVLKEGLSPFYLDLKEDETYWANYAPALHTEEVKAVILVHLYGFIHPDTEKIILEAKLKNISLIHDAAQSFGIDESKLRESSGIVYSFGPGKSSTAAGGAILKGISDNFCKEHRKSTNNIVQQLKAKLFLKSRIYGYRFSLTDKIAAKILGRMQPKDDIADMSCFQKNAAGYVMQAIKDSESVRKENYLILKKAIEQNKEFYPVFDDGNGLYFKIIFKAKSEKLKEYLKINSVPFFCLRDSLSVGKEAFSAFSEFSKNAALFIEIATEASIPKEEITRVAFILETYANNTEH